ncbi:hypothetical protein [[Phormidium ambiguum] IAM M-71]|uniref:hypothetical protein n=1 Tax=[Phormidium ambiguum] IAM M-71 TaxID=454136 RepID=UPI001F1E30A2|nr:hypothetical protein [Phormidium ambiguum]
MNLITTESIRILRQLELDSANTQTERNKLGQFATPTTLAADILKYAKTLLPSDQKIRFLDPAFGTGAFYSALLQQFPLSQIVEAIAYEIDPHYGDEVNNHQGRPLRFFFTCSRTCPCKIRISSSNTPAARH